MKIEPKKDHKKPLYALGMATVIGTAALLGGCGDPDAKDDSAVASSLIEYGQMTAGAVHIDDPLSLK